ncbi:MAG: NADH-quinone oxidoreductase subunit C, partial [Thermoplasmata archaeon]|nr:NADH-quinone oxidoreductase subunit C [Thermoplasmata archaeon]
MSRAVKVLGRGEELRRGRVIVRLEPEEVEEAIKKLKGKGYNHFVALSCVDWIKQGEFELVYHIYNYERREHVMIMTRVPREGGSMKSLSHLFPQIETYEREIHEMYGVDFPGNRRLKPFILEGWPHMPPMRKDFD